MKDTFKGQHLYVKKAHGSYTHHGLGLGDGRVIHYSGLADDFITKGVIQVIPLDKFSKGAKILVKTHLQRPFSAEESILRAKLRLGEMQYHVLHNNCEHFVEWCITGKHRSRQSLRGKLIYSAGIGTRALIGVKNPVGFIAGAAAGFAYINHQGLKKIPDFMKLESEFQKLLSQKNILLK